MKTLEVVFEPDTNDGVYAISLVENPAIEVNFIALKEGEKMQFSILEEEKRLLMGAVLVPDKKILRVDASGEPFWVVFKSETIRQAMEFFYKNGHQSNSTLEHDYKMQLDNVTFVESWIKEDEIHDKSVKYGFSEPVGTWFSVMKVDNDEVWQKVKAGEVQGFSIDGIFNFKNADMDFQKIVDAIKDGFSSIAAKAPEATEEVVEKEEEVKLEEVKLEEEVEETESETKDEPKDLEEMVKALAVEVAKEMEKMKAELMLEIEKLKPSEKEEEKEEKVEMKKVTKPNPEVKGDEPKDFKSKMLNKLNQL
jgi:hypothetical protein